MLSTNESNQFSALTNAFAMLGYLQIPVEKRRELKQRIAKRQQQQALNQKAGTDA